MPRTSLVVGAIGIGFLVHIVMNGHFKTYLGLLGL